MSGFFTNLSFLTPWALAALVVLPVIWWLLRFTPPKAYTVNFPPVRLLLGLTNMHRTPDKTPWWLLLLRLCIAALIILGVSHPLFRASALPGGSAPLLLVMDDGWAAAQWPVRRQIASELLASAEATNRPVTLAFTTEQKRPGDLTSMSANEALTLLAAHEPQALPTARLALLQHLKNVFASAPALSVIWLSDGLGQQDAVSFAQGLSALAGGKAQVQTYLPGLDTLPMSLAKPVEKDGTLTLQALRATATSPASVSVRALAANGRQLANAKLDFPAASATAGAKLDLPVELRNTVQRLVIEGQPNAAAIFLLDDRWHRKTVALIADQNFESDQPLLSPLYYIKRALEPYAELSEPQTAEQLKQQMNAGLSLLVMADVSVISEGAEKDIRAWVERGGTLLRFAGPHLSKQQQLGSMTAGDETATSLIADTLLPVTLRAGGRELGSAMSWEAPQSLSTFSANAPLEGLKPNPNVTVSRQVLAEPGPELKGHVWASLADGTPLITAGPLGKGEIILFHVTATPDWSSLPLSGQFVDMVRIILDRALPAGVTDAKGAGLAPVAETSPFQLKFLLTAAGDLVPPPADAHPVSAQGLGQAVASLSTPAGLYTRGDATRAVNLETSLSDMTAITTLPAPISLHDMTPSPQWPLSPLLFLMGFVLLVVDSLFVLLTRGRMAQVAVALICLESISMIPAPVNAQAQTTQIAAPPKAFEADQDLSSPNPALALHLAYVKTGNDEVDSNSEAGLKGLTMVLNDRTSARTADPRGVDIEADDILLYPLLYWPVLPDAEAPSSAATEKMQRFMASGGTIFFDLRDDGLGDGAPQAALKRLTAKLNVPPLMPVPATHVLTKSFYLLDAFPGRTAQGALWVENPGEDKTSNVDGVSSILVGSNDYAGAWAVNEMGQALNATEPPDNRQREMAYRTGVNIIMYVLTGNYKADQVHVPALLERLGQ